ncbi:MAG: DUF2961 domain-containing protein [Candidatus Hydrogenedentes bacterium]|nr:DUF2961 domain-containing protein [Candidatus Hydrogenedentota bacterium]
MRLAGILVVCLTIASSALGAPITTGSLVDEMADMRRLSQFPSPSYRTVQFSSYDHQSTVPGGEKWFGNDDGFGNEKIPNFETVLTPAQGSKPGEYLMCHVDGPGAVVRLWTAKIAGTVRVYLDNLDKPFYEGNAEEFFLHPYDPFLPGSGLTREQLTGPFYQRNAAYAPIPFAKLCRVVWIGNPKDTHFYEIQIRKYDEGAEVKTFSADDVKTNADSIRRAIAVLTDPAKNFEYRSKKEAAPIEAKLQAKGTVESLKLEGPGLIERLTLKLTASDVDLALRQTIMHIVFDKAPWGQVQSPIGDFFGAAPGINPYTSVPFTVEPDGTMTCRYVMPFKQSAQIIFENRGDQEVTISGSVLPDNYTWDDASSMHFRARWRVNHDLVASGNDTMGAQDLPFVIARGQGMYVGTAVMLLNPNCVPTSWGNWWGEGDEKIFVDGDVRPSTFGTGSEDYFNYAWSAFDLFTYPYCGQPRNDGPANRGFVVNYRWHIMDPLPFRSGIAFYMELFSHERTEGFSYARLSYLYARPGFMDDHVTITNEDVRRPALPPTWEPLPHFGAVRWEFKACEDIAKGPTNTTFVQSGQWQGGKALVWTPQKTDETLRLTLSIPEKGDYVLNLACMYRPDGGAFRAAIDGTPVVFNGKDSVSLIAPYHVISQLVSGIVTQLKEGEHELVLTPVEAGKPIGLDFLAIRKK